VDNVWVATLPKDIIDLGGQESTILKYELMFQQEQIDSLAKMNQELQDQDQMKQEQIDSLAKLTEEQHSQINRLIEMNQENQELQEQIARLIKMNQELLERIARLESKQELKAPVRSPMTESPMKRPPQFKHPTHGSKVKSDKKLRREQRRRDKHSKKVDKPPP
jgi:chromosome segregation ATPase